MSEESSAPPTQDTLSGVCPICRDAVGQAEPTIECIHCHAIHHAECWEYNRGCGKFGCPSAPPTVKLEDLEIPASYWGKSEKNCPVCQQCIQAAALRCRFCGATFDSAKPLGSEEFRAVQTLKAEGFSAKTVTIWMLIFAVIPCTSPLTAVIGGIWYAKNRAAIAQLPAQDAAIPKIAMLIASLETILLIAFAAAHLMIGGTE